MKTQQETFEVEMFIHLSKYTEGYIISQHDMTDNGYICLGSEVAVLGVPTKDPVEAEIEMLDAKESSLIKDHLAALHAIQCRKNDLLCIENKE